MQTPRSPSPRLANTLRSAAAALGLIFALAAGDAMAVIAINAPWVGITTSLRSARVYMEVQASEEAELVAVRSTYAKSTALRVADARKPPVAALPLPAGVPVLLAPGKSSIELIGLSAALKLGQQIPLTLVVRSLDGKEREIPIVAEVRRRSVIDDHLRHKH